LRGTEGAHRAAERSTELVLNLVAAVIGAGFQLALIAADWTMRTFPVWLESALGGLLVGALGIATPPPRCSGALDDTEAEGFTDRSGGDMLRDR
jgi:hypothetical protein